jgi:hypothetical protein
VLMNKGAGNSNGNGKVEVSWAYLRGFMLKNNTKLNVLKITVKKMFENIKISEKRYFSIFTIPLNRVHVKSCSS